MTGLPWQPGGAKGGDRLALKNGEQYLMVVILARRLCGPGLWTDWHVVEVQHDEDGFAFHSDGGWKWRWEDVHWFLPLAALQLPET